MPKMTLEKLQMVATCNMSATHKIKILKWWNSSFPSRKARMFPPKPISENLLPRFLAKCVWYARVRESIPLVKRFSLVTFDINILLYKLRVNR